MSLPFYTERSICWAVPFIFNVVRTRSIAFHNISCRPSYGLYVTKKYTAWIVLNNQISTTIEWQYEKCRREWNYIALNFVEDFYIDSLKFWKHCFILSSKILTTQLVLSIDLEIFFDTIHLRWNHTVKTTWHHKHFRGFDETTNYFYMYNKMYFSLNKSIILKSTSWSTSIFIQIVIFSSDLDICLTFYFMISINNNHIKLKNSKSPLI